jgi:hypothetical protein
VTEKFEFIDAEYAASRESGDEYVPSAVKLPPQLDDPSAELTPQLIVEVIRDVAFHYFPQLTPGGASDSH